MNCTTITGKKEKGQNVPEISLYVCLCACCFPERTQPRGTWAGEVRWGFVCHGARKGSCRTVIGSQPPPPRDPTPCTHQLCPLLNVLSSEHFPQLSFHHFLSSVPSLLPLICMQISPLEKKRNEKFPQMRAYVERRSAVDFQEGKGLISYGFWNLVGLGGGAGRNRAFLSTSVVITNQVDKYSQENFGVSEDPCRTPGSPWEAV